MVTIKEGSRVYYTSPHGSIENGIVKSINESGTHAFVVYNCNNDWDNYKDYTGQHTNIEDLSVGWWVNVYDARQTVAHTDLDGR